MLDAPLSSATVAAPSSVDTPEASPATNRFGGWVLVTWQDIPHDLKDDDEVHTSRQFKKVCESSYPEFVAGVSKAFKLKEHNLSVFRLDYDNEEISTFPQVLEYAASTPDCVEIIMLMEDATPKASS